MIIEGFYYTVVIKICFPQFSDCTAMNSFLEDLNGKLCYAENDRTLSLILGHVQVN